MTVLQMHSLNSVFTMPILNLRPDEQTEPLIWTYSLPCLKLYP